MLGISNMTAARARAALESEGEIAPGPRVGADGRKVTTKPAPAVKPEAKPAVLVAKPVEESAVPLAEPAPVAEPGVYELDSSGRYWRTDSGLVIGGELYPLEFTDNTAIVRAEGFPYTVERRKIAARTVRDRAA
jgi:hypothetical protein